MISEITLIEETFHQKWRRFKGDVFVPDRCIGIVYRNGRFNRFLDPGFHHRLNPWNEVLVDIIPVLFHATEQNIPIRSEDGFTFNIEVSTRFKFDPSQAHSERHSMMVEVALRRDVRQVVQKLMEREVGSGLAYLGGEYNSDQLFGGSVRSKLEQQLKQRIKTILSPSGIALLEPSGMLLKIIDPPPALTEIRQTIYSRQQAVKVLAEIAPELRPIDLLNQLVQRGKSTVYVHDTHFSQTLRNFYEQVFAPITNNVISHEGEYISGYNNTKTTNGHQS